MGEKVRVQEVNAASQERINSNFNSNAVYGRFGDVGCVLLMKFKEDADNYKNMVVRPDDIWVATFPRSGTTWTQEMVWLLKNDLDFETASKIPLTSRYRFLELKHITYGGTEKMKKRDPESFKMMSTIAPSYDEMVAMFSPRFIKTHLHLSLLPSNLLDTAKVIYVARDPRDVAVSYYYLAKDFENYSGDFKSFWNLFINDCVMESPFFPHLKEAWALRHHPNLLFLFYENMSMNLPSTVKKVANFLGKQVTDEQIMKLCEHLEVKNFKKNKSVNPSCMPEFGNPDAEGFVRKGKSGAWREQFDEEMTAQAQRWMAENLADTDLRFPSDFD